MLEDALALMEGGSYGLATSSGMSAITLITSLLKQGEKVISCDDVYGGTFRFMSNELSKQGIESSFMENFSAQKLEDIEDSAVKMVWMETPSNPLLKIVDIQAVAAVCKKKNWLLVVDNTFATPIFQKPLKLGADIVVHSLTKYINGHSDIVAGAVIVERDDLAEELYVIQNNKGLVCPPMDSWLVLRSLKTLPLRMHAHAKQAMELSLFMQEHSKVEKVLFPGLDSHPDHELAKKQMMGFSGMMSFYLKGGLKEAQLFLSELKLFSLAESLGGVESLIEHPGIMTHASIPLEIRQKNGIGDNFIRVSVGLEDIEDLKQDLEQALKKI